MKLDRILRDDSIRMVDGKHVCPFRYPPLSYAIHLVAIPFDNCQLILLVSFTLVVKLLLSCCQVYICKGHY